MSWRSQNENYGAFEDSRFERTNVRRIPEYGAKDEALERRRNKHQTTTGNYGNFYTTTKVCKNTCCSATWHGRMTKWFNRNYCQTLARLEMPIKTLSGTACQTYTLASINMETFIPLFYIVNTDMSNTPKRVYK